MGTGRQAKVTARASLTDVQPVGARGARSATVTRQVAKAAAVAASEPEARPLASRAKSAAVAVVRTGLAERQS